MKKTILFCFLVFGIALSSHAESLNIKLDVEKYELENGMKVLLQVDRRIPMVAVNQWYEVGSFHEDSNRTGLAHFFEHLMFKGTPTNPDGKFDQIVSNVGGRNNAFTSRDYTGYYELVPSSALEKMLQLESDRMVNLALTLPPIQKEREVVKEERRMRTENSPGGYTFEVMMEKVFGTHPYAHSVIGSMEHLNKTSLEDFMAFYKKFYAPNNSTLILVGDFDVKQAKAWIKKYYSKIPRSEIAEVKAPALQPTKNTFTREDKRFDSRKLAIYYQAPAFGTRDSFVLDVVCEVLAGDSASPISRALIEDKKIATSVSFGNYSMKYAGALMFNAEISGKNSFATAEQIFFDKVNQLIQKGVTAEQLQQAKDKISLSAVRALTTLNGKASVLAQSEIVRGDYKTFLDDVTVYQSIQKNEVVDIAKKYLNKNQSHILHLGK